MKKADFLKQEYTLQLSTIAPSTRPAWGKMNVAQMVEHMIDSLKIANGKDVYTSCITPEDIIPKMQAFLSSDKPFRENTSNPMLGETPNPVRYPDVSIAINALQQEINDFFAVFEQAPDKTILNPIFGALNFEQWVNLLYKHAMHHLRQFGRSND